MSGCGSGSAGRSYLVAASMAAVEALKDQGFARWNYPLRSLHQRLTNKLKSSSSSFSLSSKSKSASASASASAASAQMRKKTENSINKIMELDCFGPSTLRF